MFGSPWSFGDGVGICSIACIEQIVLRDSLGEQQQHLVFMTLHFLQIFSVVPGAFGANMKNGAFLLWK